MSNKEDYDFARLAVDSPFGESIAGAALAYREIVYLDGVRYYTYLGAERLRPRGRYSTFRQEDTYTYIFDRFNTKPRVVPADTKLLGCRDVWFTEPGKVKPPSILTTYPTVREVSATDWFQHYLNDSLVIDWTIVLHSRGSMGGGRGRTQHGPSVIPVTMSEGGMDISFFQIGAANRFIEGKLGDRTLDEAALMFDYGPMYHDLTVANPSSVWLAGREFVFTTAEEAYKASEAGIAGSMTRPDIDVAEALESLRDFAMDRDMTLDELRKFIERNLPED